MIIYTPYTYLIGWSKHNKFYYGRRTAKNCHPSEFWVSYFTSSKYVKKFRDENGEPDIIKIRKTFPNNPNACKLWECRFLKRINAQYNDNFLNERNGDFEWDTTGKPNVRYPDTALKREITSLKKYDVKNVFESEKIKTKIKETILNKYGVDNVSKHAEIKNKKILTCLENYGVENPSQSEEILEKKRISSLEKYGVSHFSRLQKQCKFCGELQNVNHERQCKLNPNRNVISRSGKDHPNAKTFIITSPENEIFEVVGGLRNFCKEKNIPFNRIYYKNNYPGWNCVRK